ncbi:MAG: hypothetical protein R6X12_07180 [bacterium]
MRSTSSLLAVLCAWALAAPTVRVPATSSWLRLATAYDDNVFRYSPGDIADLRGGSDPARFPVVSADDVELALSGGVRRRHRLGRRGGHVELAGKLYGYAVNPAKSHGWMRAGAAQYLRPRGRLELGFLWLPGYLVRHYRRPVAPVSYEPCRFSEYLATVAFEQKVGLVSIRPCYRLEHDDYESAFDPYDTRVHRPGVEFGFEAVPGLGLEAGYEYRQAAAVGPVPDISHVEHGAHVAVEMRPRRLRRLSLGLRGELAGRRYTTALAPEVDPGHADRQDRIAALGVELGWRLAGVRLVAGWRHERRDTESPWSERIEDIKNYRRNRFSLGAVLGPDGATGSE